MAQAETLLRSAAEGPDGQGITAIFLNAADAGELASLAMAGGVTPERVAQAAVRHVLAAARNGVQPMIRPLRMAENSAAPLYETFTVENAAGNNFKKARLIIDQLQELSEAGLDETGLARLKELEARETVAPRPR